jgi:uncharacterized protein (DUF1697 family)
MNRYIAILRGINVSGKNIIKMDALRTVFRNLEFEDVKTYVQSGNILFKSDESDTGLLGNKISGQINLEFGLNVPAIVMTSFELEKIARENPLADDPLNSKEFLHVTFLASVPLKCDFSAIEDKKVPGEKIVFSDRAVYLYCPNGYGRTKLTNTFLESKLKVKATTRNWKTVNELLLLI